MVNAAAIRPPGDREYGANDTPPPTRLPEFSLRVATAADARPLAKLYARAFIHINNPAYLSIFRLPQGSSRCKRALRWLFEKRVRLLVRCGAIILCAVIDSGKGPVPIAAVGTIEATQKASWFDMLVVGLLEWPLLWGLPSLKRALALEGGHYRPNPNKTGGKYTATTTASSQGTPESNRATTKSSSAGSTSSDKQRDTLALLVGAINESGACAAAQQLSTPFTPPELPASVLSNATARSAKRQSACDDDGRGDLMMMAVHPEWQGRGLGSMLLGAALWLWDADGGGRLRLGTQSPVAVRLYAKHGFEVVSREERTVAGKEGKGGASAGGFRGYSYSDWVMVREGLEEEASLGDGGGADETDENDE